MYIIYKFFICSHLPPYQHLAKKMVFQYKIRFEQLFGHPIYPCFARVDCDERKEKIRYDSVIRMV